MNARPRTHEQPTRRSTRGWFAPTLLRDLWRTFRADWSALPKGTVRAWIITLAIGFALAAGVSAAVTLTAKGWAPRWLNEWDTRTLLAMERDLPVTFTDAIILESPGNLMVMIPVVLLACGWLVARHRPLAGVSIVIAYVLQRPLVLLGWQVWDRARPQLIADGVASPAMHSFPSGHVALAISGYGLLAWLWIRASGKVAEKVLVVVLLVVFVAAVGLGRTRLGAHWPSDLVGGAIIGLTWTAFVALALTLAERRAGLPV